MNEAHKGFSQGKPPFLQSQNSPSPGWGWGSGKCAASGGPRDHWAVQMHPRGLGTEVICLRLPSKLEESWKFLSLYHGLS